MKSVKPAMERAARSLCELAANPPGATMEGKPLWMSYLPEVRAVIEAIREPGGAAIQAGGLSVRGLRPTSQDQALACWHDMIDAIASELDSKEPN